MSIEYEDECVDCGLPCVEYCKYKDVPHYYCDGCGNEYRPGHLYDVDGEMLCLKCIREGISFRELVEMIYDKVSE